MSTNLTTSLTQQDKPAPGPTDIFELIQITPIGFKQIIYPHSNCIYCRGPLHDVCIECAKKNDKVCNIIHNEKNLYYHEHCCMPLITKSDPT